MRDLIVKKVNKSPYDMIDVLREAKCCRDVLGKIYTENWLDQYISYIGCNREMADEAKKYIVYALVHILRELKYFSGEVKEKYIANPDELLDEVMFFGEKRGWTLDKHSALGLCSYIIEDYVSNGRECLQETSAGALCQIISDYRDDVINDICDPVWERYYDNLIFEHGEDEDDVCKYHDIEGLEKLVRSRECIPADYFVM